MTDATEERPGGGEPVAVSVIIPTFRRPEGLARAVRSIFGQTGVSDPFEIIIVDNCPDGSAASTIAALKAASPVPLAAAHEPAPGVSNARNAAWRLAAAPIIAFLDDDQEAASNWLASLLDVRRRLDAPVVFCPTHAVVPPSGAERTAFFERFFSRTGPSTETLIAHFHGAGNSLIDRAAVGATEPPFDPAMNEAGGEDDVFFDALRVKGARFAWTPATSAFEHVPPHRATMSYVLKRAFAWGQGPTQTCWERSPRDLMGVAYWMLVGAGQVLVYAPAAAALWAIRAPGRERMLDRAVQGLGKLLWFKAFRPLLYGRAQLARSPARPRTAV